MSERIKAFLIHLGISLVILAGLLYVIVFIWYPPPYFAADGGWQGIQIIAGVDIVLGPLLTLAVYNPGKGMDRLRRDLITIGVIQISALLAGVWVVEGQRTRMVVYANNRFVSLSEAQIRESGVTAETMKALSTQNPPLAYVALPDDPVERGKLVMANMGGKLLFKRGDLYQPLTTENRLKIAAEGFDLDDVATAVPNRATTIKKFLDGIDRPSSELSALPLYCRYDVLTLVMDRITGEILDTVNIAHEELIASLTVRPGS